jgi:hypothetical protein
LATERRPVFAFFRHPDGSWYRLWMTRTEPRSGQGHPWHVHATFDKTGTLAPVAGTRWYELPYGQANWDFDEEVEARAAFVERARQRLGHGYELVEGAIPDEPGA